MAQAYPRPAVGSNRHGAAGSVPSPRPKQLATVYTVQYARVVRVTRDCILMNTSFVCGTPQQRLSQSSSPEISVRFGRGSGGSRARRRDRPPPGRSRLPRIALQSRLQSSQLLMNYGTTSYTQETPAFLWPYFKSGPAGDYDRLHNRITELIALDVLMDAAVAEQLSDEERARAEDLASNLPFDVDVGDSASLDDYPDEQPQSSAPNPGVDAAENGTHPGGER